MKNETLNPQLPLFGNDSQNPTVQQIWTNSGPVSQSPSSVRVCGLRKVDALGGVRRSCVNSTSCRTCSYDSRHFVIPTSRNLTTARWACRLLTQQDGRNCGCLTDACSLVRFLLHCCEGSSVWAGSFANAEDADRRGVSLPGLSLIVTWTGCLWTFRATSKNRSVPRRTLSLSSEKRSL